MGKKCGEEMVMRRSVRKCGEEMVMRRSVRKCGREIVIRGSEKRYFKQREKVLVSVLELVPLVDEGRHQHVDVVLCL